MYAIQNARIAFIPTAGAGVDDTIPPRTDRRLPVADGEPLRDQVARGRAEREVNSTRASRTPRDARCTIVWIESVRSLAYQIAKVTASAIANTTVLTAATPKCR